jgi:imidazolonepropionase-like amidohydrolase
LIAALLTVVQAQDLKAPRGRDLGPTALVGGTLIDGTGRKPLPNSVILLRDRRIEKIGTTESLPVPSGYRTISTEGLTVLPGLWDMHTHLQYSAHTDLNHWNNTYLARMEDIVMPAIASQLLMAGVTSARDPSSRRSPSTHQHPARSSDHFEARCAVQVRRS